MMVTGALSSPMTMSGSASGFISSAVGPCRRASAWPANGGSAEAPSRAGRSATVAVPWQNSRRVICNGSSVGLRPVRIGLWLAGYTIVAMPGRSAKASGNGSLSLDGGAQAGERLAQILVLDGRQAVGDAGGARPGRAAAAGSAARAGAAAPGASAMRPIACQPKKRLTRSRITADRCWISSAAGPFDPQHQRRRFRASSSSAAARPVDLHRLAMGGDLGPGDVGPAGDDLGRGEALRLERCRSRSRRGNRKAAGENCARACS